MTTPALGLLALPALAALILWRRERGPRLAALCALALLAGAAQAGEPGVPLDSWVYRELDRLRAAGLVVKDISGLHYNPLSRSVRLGGNVQVNYLVHAVKPAA